MELYTRGRPTRRSPAQWPAAQDLVLATPLARRRFHQREACHRPLDGAAAAIRRRLAGVPQQRYVRDVRPLVATKSRAAQGVLHPRNQRLQRLRACIHASPQDAVVSPIFETIYGQREAWTLHCRRKSLEHCCAIAWKFAQKHQREMDFGGGHRAASAFTLRLVRNVTQRALHLGRRPQGKKQPRRVCRHRVTR
jgi:hypothetical protein